MKYLAIITLVCAAQLSKIMAWNSHTHLMTAKFAYDMLKSTNPAALSKAEDLLRKYSDYSIQKREEDYPFVECVTWADDIKRIGGGW